MNKLYVVSTPIGNLKDITLRAIETLQECDIILCEDTRKTGILLNHLDIHNKKLVSFYEENENNRIEQIIQLIDEGENIALVSNAGTPTISDPGFKLVRECTNKGIQIEAIPGASAILTALVSSGLPTDKFIYLGFLPEKQGKKNTLLENCKLFPINGTFVCYESPYRLIKSLITFKEVFGDIEIVVCRELTKVYEEIRREKISEALVNFEKVKPKGEFTIIWKLK
jgi:16S rRNA (cytidine1402-2'-O)-methyltransferase